MSIGTILLTVAFAISVALSLWLADSYARKVVERVRSEREEYEREAAERDKTSDELA